MKTISIVVPNYNDGEIAPILYQRIRASLKKDFSKFNWELIYVDDGSSDNSLTILKKLHLTDKRVKVIQFSRNFGHHIAITAGLDFAKGDYIVMMDGDLQDRPEDIYLLFEKLQEGFDVVYGIRANKKFGFFKKLTSDLFNWFMHFMIQENIVINSTIFRIITRQVKEDLCRLRESNRYVVGLIGWIGYQHAGQVVTHSNRLSGESKYSFFKQIQLAMNAITSFTDYPLKLASRLGFSMVFISGILTIYILMKKFIYNTPLIGWTSLVVAILFLNGIQMIILGIVGEYLGRNYLESKHRPLYIVNKTFGVKKHVPN